MVKELFRTHAFHPPIGLLLRTIYGEQVMEGELSRMTLNKALKGKIFNHSPFEKYISSGQTLEKPSKIKIEGEAGDLFSGNGNIQITCGDSSYLAIPDNSIDAVITDPPYYGNVMYSELSEFYYAWLRLALKEKYEYFPE